MKGLERLRQIRRRQQEVRDRLVEVTTHQAETIVSTLEQEADFPEHKVSIIRDGGTFLMTLKGGGTEAAVPHPKWGLAEARLFAEAIKGGLMEMITATFEGIVKEEESILAVVATDEEMSHLSTEFPDDDGVDLVGDEGETLNPLEQISQDETLIEALLHSPDEAAPGKPGPMPEGLECIDCHAFLPPHEVFAITKRGKDPLPTTCPQCQKTGTLLPLGPKVG